MTQLIVLHLPQYHPIPKNDAWWGPGLAEWRNVAPATPLFLGHYQHHLPADLGYYDLRLPELRQQQADIANQYGIHDFCYSRWGCPNSMDKSHAAISINLARWA